MFILTITIIVLRAAVRALLSALFVLFTCFIDVYFMYIFLWTNKMMMMMMIKNDKQATTDRLFLQLQQLRDIWDLFRTAERFYFSFFFIIPFSSVRAVD